MIYCYLMSDDDDDGGGVFYVCDRCCCRRFRQSCLRMCCRRLVRGGDVKVWIECVICSGSFRN